MKHAVLTMGAGAERSAAQTGGSRAFRVLFGRDLKNLFLNPSLVMYNTVFPFMLIMVMGYLTKGNYGGMGVRSYDYYGVTLLLFSAFSVAMTSANSFMEKHVKTSNLRVLYAPIEPAYVYLSKIVATFVFTSVCFALLVGVLHFWLGVRLGDDLFGPVAAIVLLTGLFSSALGVFICCIFHSEELANRVLSPVIQGMAVVGGLFFPLDGFSPTLARMSWFSPMKWVAEAVFRIIYDGDVTMFWPVIAILSVGVVVILFGCKGTFRTEDYV